ncbi:MAG TPA: archease [Gemmatimonadales bacterium]|nr:archease [Gemmatimonadales bacterium]
MRRATAIEADGRRPWHEALEHGAVRDLWVHATTWPELLAEPGRAVGAPDGRAGDSSQRLRELEVAAAGRERLLTRWLNELLYRAQAEWWIPVDFADVRAIDGAVRARVRGVRPSEPTGALTTAALERVEVDDVPGGLEARIVLKT